MEKTMKVHSFIIISIIAHQNAWKHPRAKSYLKTLIHIIMSHMMRRRKLMLRMIHPLIITLLILHRWTNTLIAIAIVLLPFGHESFLRIRKNSMRRSKPLLRGYSTASGRGGDHVSILTDTDRHVTHVHCDLACFGIPQCLWQCPNIVVGETEGFDFRELRVFRKGRQRHPETFQRVVQCVHPVPLSIIRLYSTVPFQPEHLRINGSLWSFSLLFLSSGFFKNSLCSISLRWVNVLLDKGSWAERR